MTLAMTIASLIEPVTNDHGTITLTNADEWMQGRTLYGGASALLAYTAAIRAFASLPPLRAAQIGFVAPVGQEIDLRREIVRQGRNVTQIRSELWCEGSCALTAFFLFGESREPNAVHDAPSMNEWPGDLSSAEAIKTAKAPAFIRNNFELRRGQDERGAGPPVVRRWAKLVDHEKLDPISQIIIMGDVLPPGAMRAMQRQGPISSINWSFNVLDSAPSTGDGWWLAENASQYADDGYSSERLRMWNSEGRQILDGLQSVSIFG